MTLSAPSLMHLCADGLLGAADGSLALASMARLLLRHWRWLAERPAALPIALRVDFCVVAARGLQMSFYFTVEAHGLRGSLRPSRLLPRHLCYQDARAKQKAKGPHDFTLVSTVSPLSPNFLHYTPDSLPA